MIPAVVLAAGGARRFGATKQLARVDGEALVRRAARRALAVACPVVVVTGHDAAAVGGALAGLAVEVVVHPGWSAGIGSSLAAGIRYLRARVRDLDAALVVLADQPAVDEICLAALLEAFRASRPDAVVARYGDVVGAPAILGRAMLDAASDLDGDIGARALIAGARDWVAVDLPGAAFDVDHIDDLAIVTAR